MAARVRKKESPQEQNPGKKKIILLADGTGNSSSSPHKTNVWRFYKALDISPQSGQVAYYVSGVGTDGFLPFALIGKAFGWGLAANVKELYSFLCRVYNPGDEISLFGFSRGAFSVRVLAGLIASEGIINVKERGPNSRLHVADENDLKRLVNAAYRRFRTTAFKPSFLSFFGAPIRDTIIAAKDYVRGNTTYNPSFNLAGPDTSGSHSRLIKFIGVWDTVDAYGMPVDEMTRAWDRLVWPLSAKDRNLSHRVQHARHALSLDEQRQTFEPMLWSENQEKTWTVEDRPGLSTDKPALRKNGRSMLQVWFAGVHANIGGGYPDDGLAHVSLDWMMEEAKAYAKLKFVDADIQTLQMRANHLGVAHDSRAWAGNVYRLDPRNLEQLGDFEKPGFIGTIRKQISNSPQRRGEDINRVEIARPIIHHSVFARIRQDGNGYAPINIPSDYRVYSSDSSISALPEDHLAAENPIETNDEANTRINFQNVIWNTVWYRKIIYFVTLFLFILFLTYPYLQSMEVDIPVLTSLNGSQDDRWVGSIAHAVRAVPGLIGTIPGFGFASTWTKAYEQYPFPFMILFVPIVVLMLVSTAIAKNATGHMRQVWGHLNETQLLSKPPSDGMQALARFLLGGTYRKLQKGFRVTLEVLMSVVFVGFIAFTAMFAFRIPYFFVELAGAHCEPASDTGNEFGKTFTFDPKNPCFATGLTLDSGKTYLIEMRVKSEGEDKWKDGGMDADLRGWLSEQEWRENASFWRRIQTDIGVNFSLPLRRNLLLPWYQPMARLDQYWFDRYELKNQKDFFKKVELEAMNKEEKQDCIRASITARNTRQLYLYVNDAMMIHQSIGKDYYANNRGKLEVKVRERPENETLVLFPLCTYGKEDSSLAKAPLLHSIQQTATSRLPPG